MAIFKGIKGLVGFQVRWIELDQRITMRSNASTRIGGEKSMWRQLVREMRFLSP
jgi:hypothetical protein